MEDRISVKMLELSYTWSTLSTEPGEKSWALLYVYPTPSHSRKKNILFTMTPPLSLMVLFIFIIHQVLWRDLMEYWTLSFLPLAFFAKIAQFSASCLCCLSDNFSLVFTWAPRLGVAFNSNALPTLLLPSQPASTPASPKPLSPAPAALSSLTQPNTQVPQASLATKPTLPSVKFLSLFNYLFKTPQLIQRFFLSLFPTE